MLRELGIDIDVTERLGLLSLGGQQLVEIARVVFSGAEIVILDEPTSALSGPEATRLFAFMHELKARGKSLIFISHFLEDVLAVADRVTMLKNSRKVATLPNDGLTKHHLISLMIGADAKALAEGYEGGVMLPTPTATAAGVGDRGTLPPRTSPMSPSRATGRDSRACLATLARG